MRHRPNRVFLLKSVPVEAFILLQLAVDVHHHGVSLDEFLRTLINLGRFFADGFSLLAHFCDFLRLAGVIRIHHEAGL
ncbi:hypothetical protein D3C80_1904910 [compost metagenome]